MKVRCRCGYEWEFKGKLGYATCPNCLGKVKVPRQGEGETQIK